MTGVSNMEIKSRDVSFDVLKGIGICLVLVAHSLGGYVHTFAYSFHMPLFFLVAGYFFKQRTVKEAFILDFKRIMIPFFFTGLLMLLLACIFYPFHFESIKTPKYAFEALIYGNGSSVNYHKIFGNFSSIGSVWFLGALFWSRQFFNIFSKYSHSLFVAIILFVGVISCVVGQYMQLPYSMIQGLTALPFLWLGYEAKRNSVLKDFKFGGGKLTLFYLAWFVSTFFGWLDMAQVRWDLFYFPNIILATAGTLFFYKVSQKISETTHYLKNILAFLGKYSLVLVCFPVLETFVLPLNDIISNIPMRGMIMIGLKIVWCGLALYASLKIPLLKKVFSIK